MNIQKRNLRLALIMLALIAIVITAVFVMPAEQIAFADTADDVNSSTVWDGSVASSYAGGDGSQANPYQISTAAELAYFAKETSSSMTTGYYVLTNDIVLNDTTVTNWQSNANEWMPIGLYPFNGTFDGNGYEISGLYISSTKYTSVGLFAFNYGTIENVTVTGEIDIEGSSAYYVGGVVGQNIGGSTLVNCTSNVDIAVDSTSSIYAGGIVGYDKNGIQSVENCTSMGDITTTSKFSSYVGGIAGNLAAGSSITDSTSSGAILVPSSSTARVGGIVGNSSNGDVSCSISEGAISVTSSGAAYAGGIIGFSNYGDVSYGSSSGNITVTSSSNAYAGGIIGFSNYGDVSYSTSSGVMEVTTSNANPYVGGIIGDCDYGNISNCSSSRAIIVSATDSNLMVGGIAGSNLSGSVKNSSATGKITATVNAVDKNTNNIIYAGGIVGYNISSDIINCYQTGAVSASATTTDDSYSRSANIGGIAGYIDSSSSIENCYNTGQITATSDDNTLKNFATDGVVIGAITGKVLGTVTDCYALTDTADELFGTDGGNLSYNYFFDNYGDITIDGTTTTLVDVLNANVTESDDQTLLSWEAGETGEPIAKFAIAEVATYVDGTVVYTIYSDGTSAVTTAGITESGSSLEIGDSGMSGWTAYTGGNITSGKYYLTENIKTTDTITISGISYLALNGYTIDNINTSNASVITSF